MSEYHLYAVEPQDIPSGEMHFLITPDYSLLYTDNPPPENHKEILAIRKLPPLAWEWLKDRIDLIRAEYLHDRQNEVTAYAADFTARFKSELEKERDSITEKAD